MRDQEAAEALDDDQLTDEYPPEEPLGVDEYGVTDRETAIPEPLDEFVTRREVPDRGAATDEQEAEVGHLVEPDQGGGPDSEPDAVAEAASGQDDRREVGDIASGDTTLRDTATERVLDLTAEESAMHEVTPPPMGDDVPPRGSGDGYVDESETVSGVDVEGHTKNELYERAKELDIDGRSKMNKRELALAIARAQD
jgi:hypothetical protein